MENRNIPQPLEEPQAMEENRPKRAAHIDSAQIETWRICFIMAGFVSLVDFLVQILMRYILV